MLKDIVWYPKKDFMNATENSWRNSKNLTSQNLSIYTWQKIVPLWLEYYVLKNIDSTKFVR